MSCATGDRPDCSGPAALDDDGYRIVPQVFEPAEIEAQLAELAKTPPRRSKAGARHLMSLPTIARLGRDQRMLAIARVFVGPQPQPFRATLFDKSPASNWLVAWHQDTALPLVARHDRPDWGPWSNKAGVHYAHAPTAALQRVVALRLHLDDSNERNGPLRVIAGTHRLGVLSDDEVHAVAQRQPAITCLVPSGGVLAMRPLVVHASSKSLGDQRRRVLHIEYAESLELCDGVRLATC